MAAESRSRGRMDDGGKKEAAGPMGSPAAVLSSNLHAFPSVYRMELNSSRRHDWRTVDMIPHRAVACKGGWGEFFDFFLRGCRSGLSTDCRLPVYNRGIRSPTFAGERKGERCAYATPLDSPLSVPMPRPAVRPSRTENSRLDTPVSPALWTRPLDSPRKAGENVAPYCRRSVLWYTTNRQRRHGRAA